MDSRYWNGGVLLLVEVGMCEEVGILVDGCRGMYMDGGILVDGCRWRYMDGGVRR